MLFKAKIDDTRIVSVTRVWRVIDYNIINLSLDDGNIETIQLKDICVLCPEVSADEVTRAFFKVLWGEMKTNSLRGVPMIDTGKLIRDTRSLLRRSLRWRSFFTKIKFKH